MKSIFFIAYICVFCSIASAQNLVEKQVYGRIHLEEKMNLSLKPLPNLLLQAFCQGRIKAYYPANPNVQMSYDDFLTYFGIPVPVIPASPGNELFCPNQNCLQFSPDYRDAFSVDIDYMEMQVFDEKNQQYSHDVEYLKLVLPARYNYNNKDYFGPVFKYDDVIKILPEAVFVNRQNDAAKFTLHHIFSARLFDGNIYAETDMMGRHLTQDPKLKKEHREGWQD